MRVKNSSLLLSFFCMLFTQVKAQKNTIKLGVPGLFVGSLNVKYERAIQPRGSINITYGYLIPKKISFSLGDDGSSFSQNLHIQGFYIIPEYRFYPSKKWNAPYGFYLAPYGRYYKYSFTNSTIIDSIPTNINGSLSALGIGLQIGAQFIIHKKFVIDVHFLGMSIDYNTLSLYYAPNDPLVNLTDFQATVLENLPSFNLLGTNFQTGIENNKVFAKLSTTAIGFRGGISIGYAF